MPSLLLSQRLATNRHAARAQTRQSVIQVDRQQILLSCHATLIHLGDLSRYRETELAAKERNWGPAVGFYDLAINVLPSSGNSYNQLAVIALADTNLFRATYQLYRALSAEDPHPQADTNLKRAFYKISGAWKGKELLTDPATTAGANLPSGLVAFYLRLLSLYHHGKDFAERNELEAEVISQLEVDLKKRPAEGTPLKMVMINIAAGHAAQERLLKAFCKYDPLTFHLNNADRCRSRGTYAVLPIPSSQQYEDFTDLPVRSCGRTRQNRFQRQQRA